MRMSTRGKRSEYNEEESATLAGFTVEGEYVIDFCLERDSYNSGHSKTNVFFSELIDGRPRWCSHKQTNTIINYFQLLQECAMACMCL